MPKILKYLGEHALGTASAICLIVMYFIPQNFIFNGPIYCPIKKIIGIECPTCGMTRAIYLLLHGNIKQSLEFNLLGLIVTLMLFVWSIDIFPIISVRWKRFLSYSQTGLIIMLYCGWIEKIIF